MVGGGGQRLGGRGLGVLDRDDAPALLAHLAELACCCAPALGAAPLAATTHEPNGRATMTTSRPTRCRPGWYSMVSRSTGDTYYVNEHTEESQYEFPTGPAPRAPL